MTAPIEFWHVRLPDGSVRTMTLDDLDEAFQAGKVDERTFVLKQGETSWATLGALLGLDAEAPAPSVTPAPVVVAPISYPPPSSVPLYSLRPVVSEVDDSELDLGGPQFRSSKKRMAVIAGSVGGVALVAILVATLGSSNGATASAPVAAKPVVAAAAAPPPPVTAIAPAGTAAATDRLSDAQKRALADADKALATKQAAQQKARANAAPSHHSSYKSDGKPVFHKGGDKHDPLNSSF